jgi:protease-4
MHRFSKLVLGAFLSAAVLGIAPRFSFAEAVATSTKPATATQAATTELAEDEEEPAKKVASIRLSNELLERPAGFKFSIFDMNAGKSQALSSLITSLNKAAKDPAVHAIVLDLNSFQLSLSQAQELGQLLANLKKAQKIVVVYASDYDTTTYVLATHASFIMMPDNGNILIPGVSLNMMFFRGLLDWAKVQPDFVQVGKYKGAEEPFMRKEASPEYKAQIDGLVDGMFTQINKTIAANRPNMEPKEITAAINEGWLTGKRAMELKLVDFNMQRDKLDAWLEKTLGGKFVEVKDYGSPKKKSLDLESPLAIFQMLTPPKAVKSKDPAIAVIYANGAITGDSPDGVEAEDSVTPSSIRKAVDKALKDDLVKAIVLRVDSPGGSASASDEIWQILKEADKKKPVTVSQGRLAASGGYYISCAGRSIAADPATITGSIGVVGGKLVLKGTLDMIGINVQTVSRGDHANLFSFTQPFSEEEKTFVRKTMTETYDLFKKRIKDGRGDKIKEIEDVAGGRLFTGEAAIKAGLVDKVATLNDTIVAAAKDAGIDKQYQIINLPEPKTLADLLKDGFMSEMSLPGEFKSALKIAPPAYRAEIYRMLQMIQSMQKEKMLMALPGLIEGGGAK